VKIIGLYERETIRREDLENNMEMAKYRPPAVGYAGSCVQQYKDTNIFQWYANYHDATWRAYGPLVIIDGV
jgi:hypothetical protein